MSNVPPPYPRPGSVRPADLVPKPRRLAPEEQWETKPQDIRGIQNDKPFGFWVHLVDLEDAVWVAPHDWVQLNDQDLPIAVYTDDEWNEKYRRRLPLTMSI